MASPELAQVLSILRSMTPTDLPTTIDAARDVPRLRSLLDGFSAELPPTVQRFDVDAAGVPSEWIVVPGADPNKRLLYLHGGAYVAGSRRSHRALAGRIGKASGFAVLLIDYRLAPEHPLPAAVDDALAVLRWMRHHGPPMVHGEAAPSLATHVAVGGDSAGGGLTLLTLLRARDEPHGADVGFTISAWADLANSVESRTTRRHVDPMLPAHLLDSAASVAIAGADPRSPSVSPLYADLTGLPPMLMQVGDVEILLDDTRLVAEKARRAGVAVELEVWPELFHVWHIFAAMLPEGRAAITRIGEFVRANTTR